MPERPSQTSNIAEYTVSELSIAIKRTMEDAFGYVRLRGEVSGYRGPHSSGHVYFALKDDRARIEAVIWKGAFANLAFKPEEGLEVVVTGRVTTFPGSSKYQIVIETLQPAGAGALMALLEERKKKLAAEGLFDEARKRPLPFLPQVIGIVTSPTGAVIRDMLHGFRERFPAHVIVWPVRVQGESCSAEVAAAIRGFNALQPGGPAPRPDVLIVARGGGSIEDLWGFNEEIVARAAAGSQIPLISAVGHETDWTLIDLVADARAPTPTKAAEWAVPKYSELIAKTMETAARLHNGVLRQVEAKRTALKGVSRGLPRAADLLALPRQRFDAVAARLERSLTGFAAASRSRLGLIAARLQTRLLSVRLERAHNRLNAAESQMLRSFGRLAQRQRIAFARSGGRLQPGLLMHPACRARDRLEALSARAAHCFRVLVERRRRAFQTSSQLLASLSYKRVLERGFAVVRDAAGAMLRRSKEAEKAQALEIEFADGRVAAHTVKPTVKPASVSASLPGDTGRPAHGAAMSGKDGRQGRLFE